MLSGYRYHRQGVETWSRRRSQAFANTCEYDKHSSNSAAERRLLSASSASAATSMSTQSFDKQDMNDYCSSVKLCVPCCRREHELQPSSAASTTKAGASQFNLLAHWGSSTASTHAEDSARSKYVKRSKSEYEFICNHLGRLPSNASLSDALLTEPAEEGLLMEVSLLPTSTTLTY